MIKKCSPGSTDVFQVGLDFANLPLLGSCTYSHSYCPEEVMPVQVCVALTCRKTLNIMDIRYQVKNHVHVLFVIAPVL